MDILYYLLGTSILCSFLYYAISKLGLFKRMPPGPWGLPVVGSMMHLMKNNPIEQFKIYKQKYGKIFSLGLGKYYVIVINDYKTIIEVMKKDEFMGRPHFEAWDMKNRGIVFSDGPVWNEQRRFAQKNLRDFGFGKESMEGLLVHELEELIKSLKKTVGKPFYMGNFFNASVLNSLWYILSGKRYELDDPELKLLISMLSTNLQGLYLPHPAFFLFWSIFLNISQLKWRKNAINLKVGLINMLKNLVEDHIQSYEENTTRDFIDAYLHQINKSDSKSSFYKGEGRRNLIIVLHDMFVAGAETTSTTLLWCVLYMTQHPAVQKKLQYEIDAMIGKDRFPTREDKPKLLYVEAFLNEVHRYCSLAPVSVYHRMMADTELNGYLLPKDSVVWANIHDAHHDPEYWKDPENFRPERFLDENESRIIKHEPLMPFSTGKRVCLGEALARDTLFIFFTGIVQNFAFEADPDPASPKVELHGYPSVVTSPKPFKVIIHNRKSGTKAN